MGVAQNGIYWPFKTLLQGSGISLTEDATTIRITNTGGTGGGSGDMLSSQYATNGNPGVVDKAVLAEGLVPGAVVSNAQVAASVPWSGVTGAPTSFPSDWSNITSKPSVYPPAIHGPTHRGTGSDPIGIADTTDSGLLALLSGASTDYVGGDNQCHSLPQTILNYGAVPPGSMIGFAGPNLPTGGWLWCQGQPVSRNTYSALFAAIGGTFGVGDGQNTFNVPDMRGRSPLGVGLAQSPTPAGATNHTLGQKLGEETHVTTVAEMPSHAHTATVSDPGHGHGTYYRAGATGNQYGQEVGTASSNQGANYDSVIASVTGVKVAIAAAGSSVAHNNLQPYLCLNYIIKT